MIKVDMTEVLKEKKETDIIRKKITFKKDGKKYLIYLTLQGYEFLPANSKFGTVSKNLLLGSIKKKQLKHFIHAFAYGDIDDIGVFDK